LLVGFYLLAACFALRSHANSTTSRITVLAIWMRVMLVTGCALVGRVNMPAQAATQLIAQDVGQLPGLS
jgi:hypothetical protein